MSWIIWMLSIIIRIKHEYIDIPNLITIISFIIALIFFGTKFYNVAFNIKNKPSKNSSFDYRLLLFGALSIIMGVFLMYKILAKRIYTNEILPIQKYIELVDTIKNNPKNQRTRAHYTNIVLNKYPEFDFIFYGLSLNEKLSNRFNNNVKKGWDVKLLISQEEFNKKILKTENLSFFDKHINYEEILIYDLTINDYHYLNMNKTIEKNKEVIISNIKFWSFLPVSIIFILFGIYSIILTKKD